MSHAFAEVENGTGAPSAVLEVVHPRRPDGGPTAIELRGCAAALSFRRFGTWTALVLDSEVAAGASVGVRLGVAGDAAWRFLSQVRFLRLGAVRDDERAARTMHAIEERSLAAGVADDETLTAARFWWRFDRNTHPALLSHPLRRPDEPWEPTPAEAAFRIEAGNELGRWLAARASCRRDAGLGGEARSLSSGLARVGADLRRAGRDLAPERWLPTTAALVARLLRDGYGGNAERLRRACGLFASGRLACTREPHAFALPLARTPFSQGGPDGATIALFAELALAALDAGFDERDWSAPLAAFVGMLAVFRAAFGADHRPLTMGGWALACAGPPRRRLDDAAIHELMQVPPSRAALEGRLADELARLLAEPLTSAATAR